MDLIAELAGKPGIDPGQARALAGAVLGGVEQQVAQQVGRDEADQVANAIPELEGWKEKTAALTGTAAPGGENGLLPFIAHRSGRPGCRGGPPRMVKPE